MTKWQVQGHTTKCPACLTSHTQLFVERQAQSMVRTQASRFHFFVSLTAVINKKLSHIFPELCSGKREEKCGGKPEGADSWALVRPHQSQSPRARYAEEDNLPALSSAEHAIIQRFHGTQYLLQLSIIGQPCPAPSLYMGHSVCVPISWNQSTVYAGARLHIYFIFKICKKSHLLILEVAIGKISTVKLLNEMTENC